MRIQVLTLRYSAVRGGFDDGPLKQFVQSHRVLSVSEHFFRVDEVPHLACVVRWQQEPEPLASPRAAAGSRRDEAPAATERARPRRARQDPTAGLDEEQRALFEGLRAWRRERAKVEGLPAYNVMTDRQLAALTRARPADMESLASIEGVGTGKARLFGEELLAPGGPLLQQRAAAAASDDGA